MKINPKLINKYSLNEKVVGVWINGKTLYRKTIYVSSLPNASTTTYNHNISNVDMIWVDNSCSFVQWSSGSTTSLPYISLVAGSPVSYNAMIEVRTITKTTFDIATAYDRRTASAYITFLYTKTTD